jgi:hypothetical protein
MLWAHHLDRKRGLPDRHQYACRKRPGSLNCGRMTISAEPTEELVGAEVLAHLDADTLKRHLASLDDGRADAAYAELAEAEQDRDGIEQMRASGAIKDDAFLRMHGPAEARVEAARAVLKATSGRSALATLPPDPAELAAWWTDANTSERREVVQAALDRVIIHPSGPRMSKFDAGRVSIPPDAWRV